ncbi:hypothetical protein GCM10010391_55850 [Streptomyces anthocyanicus]|nr:hypothetical protein GCM10010391_55850 [Streptomyces anthocyanicus]
MRARFDRALRRCGSRATGLVTGTSGRDDAGGAGRAAWTWSYILARGRTRQDIEKDDEKDEVSAMDTTWAAVAGAVTFLWLGMVLAISFLEAPLKFRAPGVTIPIGLGIGRMVFRALNLAEAVLAAAVVVAVATGGPSAAVVTLTAVAVAVLAVQLAVVRPRLNRRSDAVLAGEDPAENRSGAHLHYVALEIVKVLALLALGCTVLAV